MARATEEFIQGKVKFINLKHLGKFNKWGVTLYLDAPSILIVKKLIEDGIKNELKKDEDGYYITFSRPPELRLRDGRRTVMTPPTLIDKDGMAIDTIVGPGSDVGVKLEIYGGKTPQGGNYKAARLAGVKLYNHVPYDPTTSENKFERRTVSGFDKQPDMPAW